MLKKRYFNFDVVEGAKKRIIKIFENKINVVLSFSGGKDSLVLADIVYKLCIDGKIDASLLTVRFVDEEAMFEDVIAIVHNWRKRFLAIGAKFEWYCVEVKHFNCLNSLSEEETFICWDKEKKDVWVRQMPLFAITDSPYLIPKKDNYQAFIHRMNKSTGSVDMIGVRAAESIQRTKTLANKKDAYSEGVKVYPIFDMTDKDVWTYILRNGIKQPKTYENLYRVGVSKGQLRISQFFSIDTARTLMNLSETYPELMEKVLRREPNAYLVSMYWDSEMFRRSSKTRKELEKDNSVNYRNKYFDMMKNPLKYGLKQNQIDLLCEYKQKIILKFPTITDRIFKEITDSVLAGDPKKRMFRAITVNAAKINSRKARETK